MTQVRVVQEIGHTLEDPFNSPTQLLGGSMIMFRKDKHKHVGGAFVAPSIPLCGFLVVTLSSLSSCSVSEAAVHGLERIAASPQFDATELPKAKCCSVSRLHQTLFNQQTSLQISAEDVVAATLSTQNN